ncbi:MAG: alpha/beta hydrolase [Formivibrio sp.]|nr:alpha/beta hydrolase [Formivibrio sp.]
MALSVFMATSLVETNECDALASDEKSGSVAPARSGEHLQTNSQIRDLLNHPAFSGYARLLLPWDDRHYDESMPLSQLGTLLPYHSHVDPEIAVQALNRMVDDASHGNTVFYNFYTETEKQAQPSKINTGLFFFRGKPGAPFAVIAPGGGFSYVASVHEGFPYAMEINKAGYNAFVLKYRVGPGGMVATRDLAAAISFIFRNAQTLGVSTQSYSLWGSSAGARMAASIGSHGVASFGGDTLPKPATVVMAYTGHSDCATEEPPTFVVVGEQDGIVSPVVMERRVAELRKAGAEVEFHRYPGLGHGFGPGNGTRAEGWIELATRFWGKQIK